MVASAVLAHSAWAFGTKDVLQMYRDGIPDSLILQKIRHSGTTFHLSARDVRDLRQTGVPDKVVLEMLATEDQPAPPYPYWPYYHPYYSYYPYYPYYPRVVVGFGFRYYAHRG